MKQHHKRRFKTHSITGQQPDRPVTTVYKSIIQLILQTPEVDRHASDVESKAT